jgi:hypothetical protein
MCIGYQNTDLCMGCVHKLSQNTFEPNTLHQLMGPPVFPLSHTDSTPTTFMMQDSVRSDINMTMMSRNLPLSKMKQGSVRQRKFGENNNS